MTVMEIKPSVLACRDARRDLHVLPVSRQKASCFVDSFLSEDQKKVGEWVWGDVALSVEKALSRVIRHQASRADIELLTKGYNKPNSEIWPDIERMCSPKGNGYDQRELGEELNFVKACRVVLRNLPRPR